MSDTTPEVAGLRQRSSNLSDETVKTDNPSSLSGNHKDVMRKKPVVKPPFADVPMGRFMLYMTLGLLAISAFYVWRLTVFAASVGGYWNAMTGARNPPPVGPGAMAMSAVGSAAASHATSKGKSAANSAATAKSAVSNSGSADQDVQSQIYALANALGVKPAELSAAIRPLIDPSAPNPAEAAQREADLLKAQLAAGGAAAAATGEKAAKDEGPGILAAIGEALLD